MIPFLDLGATYRELKVEIDDALERVLSSGWYILGEEVELFEAEWAKYCQANYAVGVANGLDALTLALRALQIGPGDEVIVPSNTYIATWLAVTNVGATVVPVEPDQRTFNIDASQIEDAISERTKAIIVVHLYGLPGDIADISLIASKHGVAVIEDAAQAHGATYEGARIGAHSNVVCWSFYPGKNLGAYGDGGAITTNNSEIANSIRLLRNYGSSEKYVNEVTGVNSRLDPIQAAVLRVKLKRLDEWNLRRRRIADFYSDSLADVYLGLPVQPSGRISACHLYVVRTPLRDALAKHLSENGIQTLIHYPIPPHKQMAYKNLGLGDARFPISIAMANEVLSIPIGPHLSFEDAEKVVRGISSFFSNS